MRQSGVEPESIAWEAMMITATLLTLACLHLNRKVYYIKAKEIFARRAEPVRLLQNFRLVRFRRVLIFRKSSVTKIFPASIRTIHLPHADYEGQKQ